MDTALGRLTTGVAIANQASQAAVTLLGADPATVQAEYSALRGDVRDGLEAQPATVQAESTGREVGIGANQSVPGIASMFVLISLLGNASSILLDRQRGTLQRLYVAPMRRGYILLGKMAGSFLFGFLQFLIFVVVGVLLGVEWGDNILAIGLVIVAFCMTGTALGFLLATFVDTIDQASGIALLMALTLAPIGGAWWPLEIVPDFMQTIAHISPIFYAMSSFNEIIYYGGGLLEVLPYVGVLLAMTAAFTGAAVARFRYE
ncbi:MAG: ABC transporter permease [Anaerolineae bacterium]|nr:ABC transporter permease [Anaerolineae bacterium]